MRFVIATAAIATAATATFLRAGLRSNSNIALISTRLVKIASAEAETEDARAKLAEEKKRLLHDC
jgi:hypothetical protein